MSSPSPPAAEPRDVLPRSCAVIEQGMRVGLHVGAQVYAAVDGRVVADFGLGEARPGVPMTAKTVMLWLSSGKPVGATAILQLYERGKLDLHDPVCKHLPEFAQHGKDSVTLWHILTHTGGFRWVDIGWPESSWEEIIAKICAARPERDWVPGRKAGYHPFSSWYILGEIVRRVDGRNYSDYVRQEIFLPLGMIDSWIGMSVEQYHAYGDRFGIMLHTEKLTPYTHRYDSASGASVCVPGGNAHGPMHDLGRFYQMLLGGGALHGVRVLARDSGLLMTTPQRVGLFDETFKHVIDWGLGTIIDSNRYGIDTVPYGYGKYSSPHTFGHGGSQSSVAFADADHKLVAAVVFNGMPGEGKHDLRMRAFLAALYEDLGLDTKV
jgi:CubicO group peptidase (beta-lactamase class C family)